jgi:hypothetical protein
MSAQDDNPQGLETRKPTPEQREALKCAAAFAYGYCLTIYMTTYQPIYLERAKRLKDDLKAFGCFDAGGELRNPYFAHRLRGLAKAELELAKVGIS